MSATEEELVHKCHSISALSGSQYGLNTKHFLTLLSTVLLKACTVCGLLSPPPAITPSPSSPFSHSWWATCSAARSQSPL